MIEVALGRGLKVLVEVDEEDKDRVWIHMVELTREKETPEDG